MPNPASRYSRDLSIVARKIGSGFILVPIRQNVADLQYIYALNEAGSRVWELMGKGQTTAEIVSSLIQEYEVDPRKAEADVDEFLSQMVDIGAIAEDSPER